MNGMIRMQVLYEISMELGAEADLQKTAKKALLAYLSKLGCLAGVIVRADFSREPAFIEQVISVPRDLSGNMAYKEISARLRGGIAMGGLKAFLATLPLDGTLGNINYYVMELRDFGVLLLLKSGEPFDKPILHGLTQLNAKLAQACLAGLYTDRLERSVKERTKDLRDANEKLTESLTNIKTLKGLLPICAGCKKIRDDKGYWNQIESYVRSHSEAEFTHGLCPDCMRKYYPAYAEDQEDRNKEP